MKITTLMISLDKKKIFFRRTYRSIVIEFGWHELPNSVINRFGILYNEMQGKTRLGYAKVS